MNHIFSGFCIALALLRGANTQTMPHKIIPIQISEKDRTYKSFVLAFYMFPIHRIVHSASAKACCFR